MALLITNSDILHAAFVWESIAKPNLLRWKRLYLGSPVLEIEQELLAAIKETLVLLFAAAKERELETRGIDAVARSYMASSDDYDEAEWTISKLKIMASRAPAKSPQDSNGVPIAGGLETAVVLTSDSLVVTPNNPANESKVPQIGNLTISQAGEKYGLTIQEKDALRKQIQRWRDKDDNVDKCPHLEPAVGRKIRTYPLSEIESRAAAIIAERLTPQRPRASA